MKKLRIAVVIAMGAINALAQNSGVSYVGGSWSPDGKWISVTKMEIVDMQQRKMEADIYVVGADGSGVKKVTNGADGEFNPVFSRDGKTLFFGISNAANRTSELYSANVDGTGLKKISAGLNHASAPEISRDGKWIAFNATLTADANDHFPHIFVMKSDGTGIKQLTSGEKIAFYNPVWSPDGKRLVYYVERGDNKDQIWSMNADGSDQKLLTANIGHNFYPSWSADGKRIFFTSNRNGKQEMFSMNADGSDVKPMGIESFYVRQSPDGKHLLYTGGKFPNMNLFVANSDGTNAIKIL